MAELKPRPPRAPVSAFLAAIADPRRREECQSLIRIMRKATGAQAVLWGRDIVGFGSYHYRYESGREGTWFLCGFASRKGPLTLYVMGGFEGLDGHLERLGRPRTGKACLYVRRLADLDLDALADLISASVRNLKMNGK